MSETPTKMVGVITSKLIAQPGYPKIKRSGGLYELVMQWICRNTDIKQVAPAYKIAISDESVKLDSQVKRDYGHLKCADLDIEPQSTTGFSFLNVVFRDPTEFEGAIEPEWTTNSVYKEISLTADDLDLDLSPSLTEQEVKEAHAAELKRLREKGQGTRATAEVQAVVKQEFKGQFNVDSIIGTIGDEVQPLGIPVDASGSWKHIAKAINKTKAEKNQTDTYQFFNATE